MMISKTLFWCTLICYGTIDAVEGATLRLFLGSLDKYIETPLDDPSAMYPYIDKNINTTMYTGGFKNTVNGTAIITMISTFLSLKNTNVILINWEKEAQGILPNVLGYPAALISAKLMYQKSMQQLQVVADAQVYLYLTSNWVARVAKGAGKGIIKLMENGIENIRLVGHSLGAHLMGWAAEKVQECQRNVSSICGLDPAGPAFGGPISFKGLNPSQAPLVFAAHTNPGKYGTDKACGTVDFWFNCEYDGRQPGCPEGFFLPLTAEALCSHNIPWMVFSESLLNPGSFPAASAKSCSDWRSQNSSDVLINYFGYDIYPSKQGNFYLSTNSQYPYSKGEDGIRPN